MLYVLFSLVNVFKFCFNVKHVKRVSSSLKSWENTRWMSMRQEAQVFNREKCKNESPSMSSLKKHLRTIHEVKNLALEENTKIQSCYYLCFVK